jgi:hypothetical protein
MWSTAWYAGAVTVVVQAGLMLPTRRASGIPGELTNFDGISYRQGSGIANKNDRVHGPPPR